MHACVDRFDPASMKYHHQNVNQLQLHCAHKPAVPFNRVLPFSVTYSSCTESNGCIWSLDKQAQHTLRNPVPPLEPCSVLQLNQVLPPWPNRGNGWSSSSANCTRRTRPESQRQRRTKRKPWSSSESTRRVRPLCSMTAAMPHLALTSFQCPCG